MNRETSQTGLPHVVLVLITGATAAIIILAMREASSMLSTLLLAFVITIGIAPIPQKLARRMPMWLAFIITVLIVVAAVLMLVLLLGGTLTSFTKTIPQYQSSFDDLTAQIVTLADRFGFSFADIDLASILDFQKIGTLFAAVANSILSVLSNISLLLILIFFMLIDSLGYPQRFENALRTRPGSRTAWSRFAKDTRRYLSITAYTGFGVGLANAVFLMALGVDFALLWGVLAFLFSFIPNIGFLLSMIPPAILALLEFGFTKAAIVIVGYIVINALVDNVIKPRIIGDDLDISLATTFISLVFWGWVLGPIGAILAIPLTLFLKLVLLDSGDDSNWLASIMSMKSVAGTDDADLDDRTSPSAPADATAEGQSE